MLRRIIALRFNHSDIQTATEAEQKERKQKMKKSAVFVALFIIISMFAGISFAANDKPAQPNIQQPSIVTPPEPNNKHKREDIKVLPAGYIDRFRPGDARIDIYQILLIDDVVNYLNANPGVKIFLRGSVSLEKFSKGRCYFTKDYTWFSALPPTPGEIEEAFGFDNENDCEAALGVSRTVSVKAELIKRHIDSGRIGSSEIYDIQPRGGNHSLNRAVTYYYLKVPDGTRFISSREEKNGDVILTVELPTRCEQMKMWIEKHTKGIFKNGIKSKGLLKKIPEPKFKGVLKPKP
jgi:hypothetical protein